MTRGRIAFSFLSTPALGLTLFAFSAGFPPFDDFTEVDLTAHMLQHVLIVISGVLIAYPLFRRRLSDARKRGLSPGAGLIAASGLILFWHFPGPWDAAVINPGVHAVEHFSFLAVGLLSGSVLLLLSDSGKIGALLAAFFGHMGYAVALISPWNIQVYSLYPLPDQVILGWVLLLSGPILVVGIAYVIARNPEWLAGFSRGTPTRRETFLDRARPPRALVPALTILLVLILAGYFVAVASALAYSNPALGSSSTEVSINETPVSWQYSPQTITVVIGVNSTVVWDSRSISYDTVTDRGGAFSSGPIPPGGRFEFTFNAPGVYSYYCLYHPWMTGKVIVMAKPGQG